MNEWQTIDSAPWGKWLLFWWVPVNDNPWAETVVKGQVVAPLNLYDDSKPTTYWDGHEERDIARLTHWMSPPSPPPDSKRAAAERQPLSPDNAK